MIPLLGELPLLGGAALGGIYIYIYIYKRASLARCAAGGHFVSAVTSINYKVDNISKTSVLLIIIIDIARKITKFVNF